jgi:osmoprotectant transport system permease protein
MMLAVSEPWIRWAWVRTHLGLIRHQLWQHVFLTVVAVGIGLAITFLLVALARAWHPLEGVLLTLCGALYTIPSIALFAMLVPYTGFTALTAEIALVSYTLLILLRNLLAGLDAVPPDVRDAADGIGFNPLQRFFRVELPLALPALFAGIRIATVSTIALVTVASVIGQGGLGQLLLDGFARNNFRTEEVVGAGLAIILAISADLALNGVQRLMTPWSRTRAG